jgi:VacB/RNase II family 3'-5' exoribonuclease
MLDNNTLSQLKQLKQTIEAQKEYADGIVKGTQRRFGFVVLDDGREIYLAPDDMDKVFPGDKVKIQVITEEPKSKNSKQGNAPKPKQSSVLLKLIDSPLKEFTGRYIVKGKGHFVEPDLPNFSRWIFIPPAARKGAKENDFIRCTIEKHPYPHAKPQAKIVEVIGAEDKIGIEADYVVSKFQLQPEWPKNWQEGLVKPALDQRTNLTELPFVTIDAVSTVDMDDALYAVATGDGWQLHVAIADPTANIKSSSKLEKLIAKQATSIYLPKRPISMLPQELANDICSLTPQQERPALVCTMTISRAGEITNYKMQEAIVKSYAKLSYKDTELLLETGNSANEQITEHAVVLNALNDLTQALKQHRAENHIVHDNRPEFRLVLNEQCKIETVLPITKTVANSLVEECMIAANRCASDFLSEQNNQQGVFISHAGFRKERLADAKKLAKEQLDIDDIDPASIDGYRQLMLSAENQTTELPLRSVLSRLLERSRLSSQAKPHFGMGLTSYTTFTSPIRKYSDFLTHRLIKAKLNDETIEQPSQEQLDQLQNQLDITRQARNQMEQWLKCQFMQPYINQKFKGQVSQINSNGFTVRLDELHIEGFVDTRLLKEKYSFDPMRLRLKSKDIQIELDQSIEVVVSEVDCKQKNIRFELVKKPAESDSADESSTTDNTTEDNNEAATK